MIPHAVPLSVRSDAEKRLFRLLAESELDATALHSLRLHHHPTKVSGEADFVVINPRGVLVIEVKGGRVARTGTGWSYTNRHNQTTTSAEGPFAQAESAMYGLRDRLRTLLDPRIVDGFAFGFMVITPDSRLPTNTVEWGPDIVLDREGLESGMDVGAAITRAIEHWRAKRGKHPRHEMPATAVERLVEACRPMFDVLEPLGRRHDDIKREQLIATREQHAVLDFLASTDRAVVEGGAGTGKTVLAAEYARRRADAGDHVVLTCYSPVLAAYLRIGLPDTVDVVAHRSLGALRGQADLLIVDEGQDLMTEAGLDLLGTAVRGGLDCGRWVIFMDRECQRGVDGTFDEDVWALLLERGNLPRPISLRTNVRNTKPIVESVADLTGTPMPVPRIVAGPPVRHVNAPLEDQTGTLVTLIGELLEDQVRPGDITVVVPDEGSLGLLDGAPRAFGRVLRLGQAGASVWPTRYLTIATARVFKGMENDTVIVAGFDTLGESKSNTLYVALTRARTELIVLWPNATRAPIGVEA